MYNLGSTFGIIGLIFGLLGAFLVWIFGFWTIPFPILAIVFSGIGIAKDDSKAPGIIGLILGIIGLVFWILVIVLLATILSALFSWLGF